MSIYAQDIGYVYNPGTPLETRALEKVSFHLPTGNVLGILGGTGSGKTTLIKILNGLLEPTSGQVLVDGKDTRLWGAELRRKVGVVFQRPERQLFEETVYLDISYVLRKFSDLAPVEIRDRVEKAASVLHLDISKIGDRSPHTLSEGSRRKVAIAGVLVNEPEMMIFDEPAVGLDPPSIHDLLCMVENLKRSGKTIVIVSHDMDVFLGSLDYLLVLDHGKIAAFGSPEQVCTSLIDEGKWGDIVPPLARLVHELRREGGNIPSNPFHIPALVEMICRLPRLSGGSP